MTTVPVKNIFTYQICSNVSRDVKNEIKNHLSDMKSNQKMRTIFVDNQQKKTSENSSTV